MSSSTSRDAVVPWKPTEKREAHCWSRSLTSPSPQQLPPLATPGRERVIEVEQPLRHFLLLQYREELFKGGASNGGHRGKALQERFHVFVLDPEDVLELALRRDELSDARLHHRLVD